MFVPSYIYEYVGFSRRQKQFLGNAEVRTFPDFWRCDTILSTHTTTYLLTYIAFNRDDGGHRQVSFAFLSLHHHTLLMLQFFWPYYGLYLLNYFVYILSFYIYLYLLIGYWEKNILWFKKCPDSSSCLIQVLFLGRRPRNFCKINVEKLHLLLLLQNWLTIEDV